MSSEFRIVSKLTVEISESLQRSIAALAREEGYSIDQFLATAAAEKIAAIRTIEYLRREAADPLSRSFQFVFSVVQFFPSESRTGV